MYRNFIVKSVTHLTAEQVGRILPGPRGQNISNENILIDSADSKLFNNLIRIMMINMIQSYF